MKKLILVVLLLAACSPVSDPVVQAEMYRICLASLDSPTAKLEAACNAFAKAKAEQSVSNKPSTAKLRIAARNLQFERLNAKFQDMKADKRYSDFMVKETAELAFLVEQARIEVETANAADTKD